jgi:DNA repair ATPase RecN
MDPHMTAIVELRERVRAHDEDIARHDQHLVKLDETVSELRAAIATVATKDDINKLRVDISEKFGQRMTDALNAIPAKWAAIFAGGLMLVEIISLFVKSHG